jgi:enoyl-CoA hydratase/carnithine racemase
MLLLTGDFYSAQEAYNWGEVDKVVPADKMEETALAIASKLARFDQKALRLTKEALWKVKSMTQDQAYHYVWDLLSSNAATEAGQKMMKEYREKVAKATGLPHIPGAKG